MALSYDDQNLTKEELDIENNLEKFTSIPNPLKKRKKSSITIRLFTEDIQKIKQQSHEEGIPYQTLISSLIHKIANKKIELTIS